MNTHRGIDFKIMVEPVEGADSFRAKFALTDLRGGEILDHMAKYVLKSGTDEPAEFTSESKAKEAAEQVAINKIEAM